MAVITKRIKLVGSKGSVEVEGLFDTGASYSFVRKDIAQGLATMEPLPQPMRFEMAQQGQAVEVKERVVLDFWLQGYRFSDEFMVLDGLSDPVIVGASTMQKWRIKLDLEREEVLIDPSVTRLRFV